jgi:hypothetical protein
MWHSKKERKGITLINENDELNRNHDSKRISNLDSTLIYFTFSSMVDIIQQIKWSLWSDFVNINNHNYIIFK